MDIDMFKLILLPHQGILNYNALEGNNHLGNMIFAGQCAVTTANESLLFSLQLPNQNTCSIEAKSPLSDLVRLCDNQHAKMRYLQYDPLRWTAKTTQNSVVGIRDVKCSPSQGTC